MCVDSGLLIVCVTVSYLARCLSGDLRLLTCQGLCTRPLVLDLYQTLHVPFTQLHLEAAASACALRWWGHERGSSMEVLLLWFYGTSPVALKSCSTASCRLWCVVCPFHQWSCRPRCLKLPLGVTQFCFLTILSEIFSDRWEGVVFNKKQLLQQKKNKNTE